MNPTYTSCLILLLASAALGGQNPGGPGPAARRQVAAQPAALTLKQVRGSFTAADADKDGVMNLGEATASGLGPSDFALADSDDDLVLSEAEYIVVSEWRAARSAAGVAGDLRAESTRLQALRRAQRSQELLARRESRLASPRGARGKWLPQEAPIAEITGPSGPAGARGALALLSAEERAWAALQVRAAILMRVRSGELSAEAARPGLEAVDRRIAAITVQPAKARAANPTADAVPPEIGPGRPLARAQHSGDVGAPAELSRASPEGPAAPQLPMEHRDGDGSSMKSIPPSNLGPQKSAVESKNTPGPPQIRPPVSLPAPMPGPLPALPRPAGGG